MALPPAGGRARAASASSGERVELFHYSASPTMDPLSRTRSSSSGFDEDDDDERRAFLAHPDGSAYDYHDRRTFPTRWGAPPSIDRNDDSYDYDTLNDNGEALSKRHPAAAYSAGARNNNSFWPPWPWNPFPSSRSGIRSWSVRSFRYSSLSRHGISSWIPKSLRNSSPSYTPLPNPPWSSRPSTPSSSTGLVPNVASCIVRSLGLIFTLFASIITCGRSRQPSRMRHYLRNTALFLGAFNAIIILYVMFAFFSKPSYTYYPAHYKALARLANDSEVAGRANPRGEKVFIAASIVDKNGELLGGQWGTSMVELVDLLGPNNVYLSVYENGADPRAVGAMRNLSESVQCSSSFVADNLTYDQIRHIELPNGESRVKRIEYLAEVRNRALRPLEQSTPARRAKRNGRRSADSTDVALFESHHGTPAYLTTFDRVLFLNDIYFSPVEATQLLFATNSNVTIGRGKSNQMLQFFGRSHTTDEERYIEAVLQDPARNFPRARYRAACAVDFINPFKFYDTFASRDLDGYSMGLPFFPWFSREGSHTSRDDAQAQSDAVRVRSCWGGMAAYEAYWFQDQDRPLRFRAEPGPYWDASECCLVNADLANLPQPPEPELVLDAVYQEEAYYNETDVDDAAVSSSSDLALPDIVDPVNAAPRWNVSNPGIFMNPFVRVAYDAGAFHWERIARRPEQIYAPVHALLGWLLELPGYNPRRRDVREGGFCGARRILLINERPEVGESRWQRTVVPEPVEATATATPGAGV